MFNQLICLEPSCELVRIIDNPSFITKHTEKKHQCVEKSQIKEQLNKINTVNLNKEQSLQMQIEKLMEPFINQIRDALRSHIIYYLEQAIPKIKIFTLIHNLSTHANFDYNTLNNEDFINISMAYNGNIQYADVKHAFEQEFQEISKRQKQFCQLFIQNLKQIFVDIEPQYKQNVPDDTIIQLCKFESMNNLIQYSKNDTKIQYKGAEEQICLVEGELTQNCKIKVQLQKPHFLIGIIDLSKQKIMDSKHSKGKYYINLEGKFIVKNQIIDTKLAIFLGGTLELEWKYAQHLLIISAGKKKIFYEHEIPFDDTSNLRIAVWLKEGGQIEIIQD